MTEAIPPNEREFFLERCFAMRVGELPVRSVAFNFAVHRYDSMWVCMNDYPSGTNPPVLGIELDSDAELQRLILHGQLPAKPRHVTV